MKHKAKSFIKPDNGSIRLFSLCCLAALMASEPALAQNWAATTKTVGEQVVTGLRVVCYPIAVGTLIWGGIGIWLGTKRFQDLVPWFVGAAVLIAAPDLAKLIPGIG